MPDQNTIDAVRRGSRLAGLGYVASVAAGFGFVYFLGSNLIEWGEPAVTAQNLSSQEGLFRIGIVLELAMAAFVGFITFGLYLALRPVTRTLALAGLVFRTVEVALVSVIVVMKLAALKAIGTGDTLAALSMAQREGLSLFFAELHGEFIYISMVFTGLGGLMYCLAFFQSRFIPRWLSGWGIVTYIGLMVGGAAVLARPELWQVVQISFIPGAAFEALVGLWLLIARPDTSHWARA